MMEFNNQSEKYIEAKKRVEDIKKFYKHLFFYLVINFFFIGRRIYRDINHGDSVIEAITDISNYRFFFWWGIILIFHALNTFKTDLFFSKDWEKCQIEKEMKNDERYN